MTVDKNKTVNIPIWLISVLLPLIVALVVSYGMYQSTNAKLQVKIDRNEIEIEKRVTKDEIYMIIKSLERIERKLDNHIAQQDNSK